MGINLVHPLTQIKLLRVLQRLNDCNLIGGMWLMGLLLRIPFLKLGLWRDEATTYFNALPTRLEDVIQTVILCERNPPAFFLVMHQWMRWFGGQELVFKLPTLAFGLLLILATYFLGRTLSSRATGLLAAMCVTVGPSAVFYSQEARPYTLAALLSCLSVLFYFQALNNRHRLLHLSGFVLITGLLTYVTYLGLLLAIVLAMMTVLLWSKQRQTGFRLLPFIFAFAAIFLIFLPWVPILLEHLSRETPWETRQELWRFPIQIVNHLSTTIPLVQPLPKILGFFVLFVLSIRVFQFIGASRNALTSNFNRVNLSINILETILLFLTTLEAFLLANGKRYMFPFAPISWVVYSYWILSLYVFLAHRAEQRWNSSKIQSSLNWAFLSILIFTLLLPNVASGVYRGYQALYQPRSGVRSLVVDVKKSSRDKTFFLIAPDIYAPTFGYYASQLNIPFPFYGFPRWDTPQLFSSRGYVQLWQDPKLIENTEQRILAKVQQGYHRLGLVTPFSYGNEDAQKNDRGFTRPFVQQLFTRLKLAYPIVLAKEYPGSESANLYLFDLTNALKAGS